MTFDRRVLGLLLVLGLLGSPAALISALCVGESCRRSVSLRTTYRSRLTPKAASAAGFLVLPVVAVLVLPPATLGSFAVARRSAVGAGYVASGADISSGPVTLNDVVAAMWSPKGMEQLSRRAGSSVSFVGFVDRREGMAANEFLLTRFVVTCCVADALSVQVRVVGARPDALQEDQWVRVTGTLYPLPQEAVVKASTIESVPRPARPYLDA
jgi:putative membrane protein